VDAVRELAQEEWEGILKDAVRGSNGEFSQFVVTYSCASNIQASVLVKGGSVVAAFSSTDRLLAVDVHDLDLRNDFSTAYEQTLRVAEAEMGNTEVTLRHHDSKDMPK
jgi:hypothetical protein